MTSIFFTASLAAFFYLTFFNKDFETGVIFLVVALLSFGYKMFRAALGLDYEDPR